MSTTLGGLIKYFRFQKNISQIEIAIAMGWSEPSRLSRIEQGLTQKPPREVLDRLMNVMRLEREECGQLLLVGGYLPTKEEIEQIRKETAPIVDQWNFPASVMDFSWRLIFDNQHVYDLFQIDQNKQKWIREEFPRIHEIVFEADYILNKNLTKEERDERNAFNLRMLIHYQYSQRAWIREKWFLDFLEKMIKNDYFRVLWSRAKTVNLGNNKIDLANYSTKYMIHPDNSEKKLSLYFFITPVLQDPRFSIEFHVPADLETYKYFHK